MRRMMLYFVLAAAATWTLAGCDRIGEPWDEAGYFAEERVRSPEQHRRLRQRLLHTQSEMGPGMHHSASAPMDTPAPMAQRDVC
jgi:hypothetical protein